MLIDPVPQARVSDRIEPHELIERIGVTVGQHEAMETDGEPCLAERLHRLGRAQDARTGRNQEVLSIATSTRGSSPGN